MFRKTNLNERLLARGVCDEIERAMQGPGLRRPVIHPPIPVAGVAIVLILLVAVVTVAGAR